MATTVHAKATGKKSVEMLKKELPPDWEVVTAPETKKRYYWNKRTNETSWKFPHAEAEAHKAKVDEHLYQNVQLRTRVKSADDSPAAERSTKADKKYSSVPPQTPPPPVGPKPGVESSRAGPKPVFEPPPVGPKPGVESSHVGPNQGAESGDVEYSTVSQDWIDKKRSGTKSATANNTGTTTTATNKVIEDQEPPALPPRSELSDQLDEDLYDLPFSVTYNDTKKVLPASDKATISSSSITVGNTLYQSATDASKGNNKSAVEKESLNSNSPIKRAATVPESSEITYDVIADVKSPVETKAEVIPDVSSRKSPVETGSSPLVTKKMMTLPKPSSEVTYDVVSDVHVQKSLTMPASNHRSPSPEYAVVHKSPVMSRPPLQSPVRPNSPASTRPLSPSREYAYIGVGSSSTAKQVETTKKPDDSEYDLPVTAREKELRINSPPSPMLSNYAKLRPKDGVHNDKQQKLPKQATDSKKKTKAVSVDASECSKPTTAVNSVDKAIEELEKGLEDSGLINNHTHSIDLHNTTVPAPKPSGDMGLDWDDSDMTSHASSVQQGWLEKRKQNLVGRSYEEVLLSEATNSPSLPEKLRRGWSPRGDSGNEKLPPGWSKVIGEDGVYYWHVKSGKTQWTMPTETDNPDKLATGVDDELKELNSTLDDLQIHTMNYAAALASSNDSTDHDTPKTFGAVALGWEEVDETELVRGQMVNVVHACIRRITVTKGDNLKDAIATGGQGKEVFLQIQGLELRLLDPRSSIVLSVQQINKIRVWGIGKENERDFGYIARDHSTQRYKCHVFRCQVPAQAVARALVDNHSKAKKSKCEMQDFTDDPTSLYMDNTIHSTHDESNNNQSSKVATSTSIDDDHDDAITESSIIPIPTENESYQRFECVYLGKVETKSAYGIDTIVDSLTKLNSESYKWIEVFMDIASSHIKILDRKSEDLLQEHRVRFLSFLGINPKDEKCCGYIVDNGDSQFMCHGFMADPNTNKMCIALHGACQARFQRVLDSQPQQLSTPKEERRQTFSFFKKKTYKKQPGPPPPPTKSNEPLYKYTVQILGSMSVNESANLDNVKECVQQLTEKFKLSQSKQTTGDFEIFPTGLTIVGHQKRLFSKKHYSFKNVTYCVKLKNYFAFVYRESSSKCVCHVFAELEVDAATIVCAIQKTIMPLNAASS